MKKSMKKTSSPFVADARSIILEAKAGAVRSVDLARVMMYWKLGERIVIEEQIFARGRFADNYNVIHSITLVFAYCQ